ALPRELDDALDVVLRDHRFAGSLDRRLEERIRLRIETTLAFPGMTGFHHRVEVLVAKLGTGNKGRDLLLFLHLPVDVALDVRMIEVNGDHLRGAAGGTARLDGAGGPIADLQKGHQARGLAAAGKRLLLPANPGEVGAGPGAVLEKPRFTGPEV